MPEPILYIWLRSQFCIRYSLAAFRQSSRQISNSTSHIFNSIFEFLFTLQWSLVETKPLWRWEMTTYRPPPLALSSIMLSEKGSVGNCPVPVWRFLSASRSIRFGEVSEANGRDTRRQKQNVHACVAFWNWKLTVRNIPKFKDRAKWSRHTAQCNQWQGALLFWLKYQQNRKTWPKSFQNGGRRQTENRFFDFVFYLS